MNHKKIIFLTAVIIILGSVIVPALADWTAPLNGPTICDINDPGCAAPINVSGTYQSKAGGLGVGTTVESPLTQFKVIGNSLFGSGEAIFADKATFSTWNGGTVKFVPPGSGIIPTSEEGEVLTKVTPDGIAQWLPPTGVVGMPLGKFGQTLTNIGTTPANTDWATSSVIYVLTSGGNPDRSRVGIGASINPYSNTSTFCADSLGNACLGGYIAPNSAARLDIAGKIAIRGTVTDVPAAGKVLTADDATGLASWTDPLTLSGLWTTDFAQQTLSGSAIKRNSQVAIGEFGSLPLPSVTQLIVNSTSNGVGRAHGIRVIGDSSVASISGENSNTNSGHGVYGIATGSSASGVYGTNDAVNGTGIFGYTTNTDSKAVKGQVNNTSGANYGVYGEVNSTTGSGVYGKSTNSSGTGVYGTGGQYGVYAENTGATPNAALYVKQLGDGYGIYEDGGSSAKNLFKNKVTVGGDGSYSPISSWDRLVIDNGNLHIRGNYTSGSEAVRGIVFDNPPNGATLACNNNAPIQGMVGMLIFENGANTDVLRICAKKSGAYAWRTVTTTP